MSEQPFEPDRFETEADLQLRIRELVEIEKMRNLEIARVDDEIDAIHKTKDKRITGLTEELWHSNRRADDLDRRWNELARAYEQVKTDLENTGRRLDEIQHQRSYRMMTKLLALANGGSLRAMLGRRRHSTPLG